MIRKARVEDLDQLLKHGKAFIEYHPCPMKWDAPHMTNQLRGLVQNHVVLVDEEGGVVRGAIGGILTPNFYDPSDNVLTEFFWWVGEPYRKGRVGLELFRAFEEVGRILGASSVAMCTTSLTPQLEPYYEKKGYTKYETTYKKEL